MRIISNACSFLITYLTGRPIYDFYENGIPLSCRFSYFSDIFLGRVSACGREKFKDVGVSKRRAYAGESFAPLNIFH